jgi:hypothetical protein
MPHSPPPRSGSQTKRHSNSLRGRGAVPCLDQRREALIRLNARSEHPRCARILGLWVIEVQGSVRPGLRCRVGCVPRSRGRASSATGHSPMTRRASADRVSPTRSASADSSPARVRVGDGRRRRDRRLRSDRRRPVGSLTRGRRRGHKRTSERAEHIPIGVLAFVRLDAARILDNEGVADRFRLPAGAVGTSPARTPKPAVRAIGTVCRRSRLRRRHTVRPTSTAAARCACS